MIIIETINKILWIISISVMLFNAVYFTFKLKFIQFNLKKIISCLLKKETENGISIKDSLFMSLAAKIGIGSLAGIAFAIYYGGVGTIFWIWIFTFFVSINSFLEKYLAVKYKEKDGDFYKGGPAYYIKNGLNKKNLSLIYSFVLIFAYIFGFLSIQSNTMTILVNDMFSLNKVLISMIICILSSYFIFKGLKSISNLCNKIVPFMSIIYIIIGFIIIIVNITEIPNIIESIVSNALNFRAISGGFITSFFIGIQKSIFSSESGIGTGAIASGTTTSNNCEKQGYVGIIETYFINFIITTITAFLIILSNYNTTNFININGIELTKYAFSSHLGVFGEIILLVLIILFSFSTIVTGYYYGESNLKNITNSKIIILILKILTIMLIFVGGISRSNSIWNVVDLFVAILAIINVYSIFKLRKSIEII